VATDAAGNVYLTGSTRSSLGGPNRGLRCLGGEVRHRRPCAVQAATRNGGAGRSYRRGDRRRGQRLPDRRIRGSFERSSDAWVAKYDAASHAPSTAACAPPANPQRSPSSPACANCSLSSTPSSETNGHGTMLDKQHSRSPSSAWPAEKSHTRHGSRPPITTTTGIVKCTLLFLRSFLMHSQVSRYPPCVKSGIAQQVYFQRGSRKRLRIPKLWPSLKNDEELNFQQSGLEHARVAD
jgi:hypothetical protein